MKGGNGAHVDRSEAALDVLGVSLGDKFSLILPCWLLVMRRKEDEGSAANDESEVISVGGHLANVVGYEPEGSTFEEAFARTGLISVTETVLDTTSLPLC